VNKHVFCVPALILSVLFFIPARASYLYISSNLVPDSTTPVVLLETDTLLDPVPSGFTLTTPEEVHARSFLTPTEARAQAQYLSGPQDDQFGSFLYFRTGPTPYVEHDAGGIGPDYKWAVVGGWTKSYIGDEQIGVGGKTNRDRVTIVTYPLRFVSTGGQPFVEIRYVGIFCYNTSETHYWEQFSEHWWQPSGNHTYSGVQGRY